MRARLALVLCAAALLGACSEQPQTTNASVKKSDAQAWHGADNRYVAGGWKVGDRDSWDEQLNDRAQKQNEYKRIGK